jgi:hypothetical protein
LNGHDVDFSTVVSDMYKTMHRSCTSLHHAWLRELIVSSRKVTCHQIAEVNGNAFSNGIGLVDPRAPSEALNAFVCNAFAFTADNAVTIKSGLTSKHSPAGFTSVDDIVVFRDEGNLCAGIVYAHLELNGVPISCLIQLELLRHDRKQGTAIWRKRDAADFVETRQIVDACIWETYGADEVRLIIPRDAL